MRTPDRVTTETHKRPASQLAEHLARSHRPLKPSQAHSKKRQQGDRKQPKAAPVAHNPDAIKHILNRV